ncbi:pre-mRNA-splicing factor SPF27 [Folsomia candida]|uniref:Pre-mRNA-splicing factor SPF27 n=1 Tax=Folsomia candida TaxID=158441 RepID=A0A226EH68_FOLCA|nr:pre-mRNA-splicing factor SPF27 [Folsomia candida]OXA56640.1 Pre-mRNA-splicing factor SPF27 [Folsomia candida]
MEVESDPEQALPVVELVEDEQPKPRPSIIIDALPYIDTQFEEPGMKEMVTHLIEEEKRRFRPTKNYLEHLPKLEVKRFETPLLTSTYASLAARNPPEVLSMKRYELPPPPAGKLTDLAAWSECVDNSSAQLFHQQVRLWNLELMLDYSCEGWKNYLEILTRMVGVAGGELAEIKKRIQSTNWSRKSTQLTTGEQLGQLESSWVSLVSKNYEIERACLQLESMIEEGKVEVARSQAMNMDE